MMISVVINRGLFVNIFISVLKAKATVPIYIE